MMPQMENSIPELMKDHSQNAEVLKILHKITFQGLGAWLK
jgi:hypothetical protein